MIDVLARPVVTLRKERATSPDGRALIDASENALREVFPPDECFSFDAEELDAPHVTFWIARIDGEAKGCVALVDAFRYGEIKRLYVAPEARSAGIGRALMNSLEAYARASGIRTLKLESGEGLQTAMALYRRMGYEPCPPFGGYPDIASNAFLEKRLF